MTATTRRLKASHRNSPMCRNWPLKEFARQLADWAILPAYEEEAHDAQRWLRNKGLA